MDGQIFWRAALVQLLAVAVVSLILAILLPDSFFDSWGWLSGPLAWLACAAFTARFLYLPPISTLVGAVLAGIPSLLFVVLGAHWLGALVAVGLFAAWCARLPLGPVDRI
jgi:hypothetical protein